MMNAVVEALKRKRGNLICPHCGHCGKDVSKHLRYIGGQGYVEVICCDDEVACWARWDAEWKLIRGTGERLFD